MKQWLALGSEYPGGDCHVMPIDDIKEHVDSRDCPCGPRDDGDGVIIHHSYDRREYAEQAAERARKVGLN